MKKKKVFMIILFILICVGVLFCLTSTQPNI